MKKSTILAALLLTPLTSFAFSPLTSFAWKPETSVWKATISGVPGEYFEIGAPGDWAIYGIGLVEHLDDPYKIKVRFNRLTNDAQPPPQGTSRETKSPIIVNDEPEQVATAGGTHHMTALRVCTNNDKIKGLQVWGRFIRKDGTLSEETGPDSFVRKNCSEWGERVACGENKVITGVRAYYKSKEKGFSGLAIRCTAMQPKTP